MTPDPQREDRSRPTPGPISSNRTGLPSPAPTVSIVICTQGLRPTLSKCLASLQAQSYKEVEVIVALNGPSDEIFSQQMAKYPVRLVVEPRRGVCVARNTAIQHVSGEFIAFLDDDVEPDPGWIQGILDGFQDDRTACVTGRIVPAGETYLDSERLLRFYTGPRVMSEWTLDATDPEWVWQVLGERVGAGCNMAFRRSFLMNETLFPEDLGAGSLIGIVDDDYMFLEVLKRGFVIHHTPHAVVTHYFDDDLPGRRRRTAQVYSGSLAATLKLFCEKRGIRFQLLKAMLRSMRRKAGRTVTRTASTQAPPELLTQFEKLRAILRGFWVFAKSRSQRNAPTQSPPSKA